ncbi:MAG: hypothetical protein ACKOYI_04705, partial [Actinomycetota bacterium]
FLVKRLDPGPEGRWRIALDDSPTRRYGRCVEASLPTERVRKLLETTGLWGEFMAGKNPKKKK